MFEVSFYTAEGTYTFPLSSHATSWKKARLECRDILYNSGAVPDPLSVKDLTIWEYHKGKLSECHTWFWNAGGDDCA